MIPATDLLSPSDLLKLIRHAQSERANIEQLIDTYKQHLQELHDQGVIGDSFEIDNISAKLVARTTYKYSAAVKQLQDLEKVEGVASKSTSHSWTITEKKSASSHD